MSLSRLARLGAALTLATSLGAIALTSPSVSAEPAQAATGDSTSKADRTSTKAAGAAAKKRKPASLRKNPQPKGVPGHWRLIWRDEFRGQHLNTGKWRPNWLAGSDNAVTKPINSAEKAAYDPRQVSVKHGKLRLKAVRRTTHANDGRTYQYASGIVESAHDFRFTHGYAEARIYLPPNRDRSLGALGSCGPNWAAFWINGETWPDDGEIDVMECLSDDDASWHYHWSGGQNGGYPNGWQGDMPGSGGWHTFGVNWTSNALTFYYDGKRVGRQTEGVTSTPHYLILNLAISDNEIKVPQTMKVGYVRVWK
jgi:beta-glucanase (GH16 family)